MYCRTEHPDLFGVYCSLERYHSAPYHATRVEKMNNRGELELTAINWSGGRSIYDPVSHQTDTDYSSWSPAQPIGTGPKFCRCSKCSRSDKFFGSISLFLLATVVIAFFVVMYWLFPS